MRLGPLMWLVALAGALATGVGACSVLQPELPLAAAVAQLIPNDPPIAQHSERIIGDDEIMLAIEFWIKGNPVPQSGGRRINDIDMKHLIELWANNELI